MTAPRVWVGRMTDESFSYWQWSESVWWRAHGSVSCGDIFMTSIKKPTIDVREIDTLQTCKVVDW